MGSHAILGVLLIPLLTVASAAAPKVEGEALGVDPYVQEFQTAMQKANTELAAIQAAILAVQVPPGTKAGALAAGAKAAGEYAAVEAVVLRAEAAHAKFLTHIMGFDPSDDLDIKLNLKGPAFAEKKDAPLRPKADNTFKGGGGGVSKALAGGAAPVQKLSAVSSKYSYSSAVGPVGAGFPTTLSPSEHQAAAVGTIGVPVTAAAPSGMSVGAGDGSAGVAKAASAADAAPTVGPSPATLSVNTSNVAEVAFQRAQERQRAAEQAMQAKQREKDQRNQQMAQMAQQMLGQAGQAMGKAKDSAGGCKNCNQKKQQESQQAAAAAPA